MNAFLAQQMQPPQQQPDTVQLTPDAGFVLKTHLKPSNLDSVKESQLLKKIFINICHHHMVPPPPLLTDEEVAKAIQSSDNSTFRIPLSLSVLKTDKDKTGKECLVVDACMHPRAFDKASEDDEFKMFLVELCLQWVENRYQLELSRGEFRSLSFTT